MDALASSTEMKITVKKVPTRKRLGFLPGKMPRQYLKFERCVYSFASGMIKGYNGGFWDFIELSNDGFYIRPESDEVLTVSVDGNGFMGTVSGDAAGVIVSMFALCYLAEISEDDRIIELYYLLRNFINDHAEAELIWRAID